PVPIFPPAFSRSRTGSYGFSQQSGRDSLSHPTWAGCIRGLSRETHRGRAMNTARGSRIDRGPFTRRSFFQGTLMGTLVCNVLGEGTTLRAASRLQQKRYDLLIRGGRVIDP